MEKIELDIELLKKNIENIKNKLIDNYITEPLKSNERSIYHEIIRQSGLTSESLNETSYSSGGNLKRIKIFLSEKTKENNNKVTITREIVEFFSKMTGIPIPSNNPEYIEYYLKKLSKYYSTELWKYYVEELEEHGIGWMRGEVNKVKTFIIEFIKNNEEYIKYCKKESQLMKHNKYENIISSASDVYQSHNIGKYYISVDVRKANFTFLKHECPNINCEWEELVEQSTNSKFIKNLKPLREIIFGQLGNKKLLKEIIILIEKIDDIVKSSQNLLSTMRKTVCSTDEIIYEINKDYDGKEFMEKILEIDPDNKIYKIEFFRLKKLNPYKYFVKEIFDENLLNEGKMKSQFKMIPKKHLMQCVKKYENDTDINIFDLTFTFEDEDVVFVNHLKFD